MQKPFGEACPYCLLDLVEEVWQVQTSAIIAKALLLLPPLTAASFRV